MLAKLYRKALFRVRWHYLLMATSALRVVYWRSLGMNIGPGTRIRDLKVTWPHRVSIGSRCNLEHSIYLNIAGPYADRVSLRIGDDCFIGSGCEFNMTHSVVIGNSCLIASGTRFIDHDHGTLPGVKMKEQPEVHAEIEIGSDVWIGVNCVILKGVTIGSGAIVAAGSVVTKSVQPCTVVGGVPARILRNRQPI